MSFNKVIFQREPDPVEPVKDYGYRSSSEEEVDLLDAPEVLVEPVAPIVEPTPAEPVTPVAPVEPVVEPAKPVDVTPADWKAALKTADKYEALKELGYDDFTIDMLKYKEQTGDLTPYLEVKTINYAKIADEDLLKLAMKKENPGMSDRAIEFKFNKELSEKYYLDRDVYAEDSDEAIYGQEQMRLDAEAKRNKFIEDQAKFKAPEPKPDTSAAEKAEVVRQRQEKQKGLVLNHPITKALQSAKKIVFGEGEESFSYPLPNADAIINQALTTIQSSETVEIEPEKLQDFYHSLAFSANPKAYLDAYDSHRDSVAKRKLEKELGNVTPVSNGIVDPPVPEKDYGYKTK